MDPEPDVRWSTLEMSNYDHEVSAGLEADLKAGARSRHSAWDFYGEIWYDPEANVFREQVKVYGAIQGIRSAATLQELMTVVNNEFGWE